MELWVALLGAVLGGLLTIGGAWAQAAYYRRTRIRALKAALAAEIATCVQIARMNEYERQFLQMAEQLRQTPSGADLTCMHIPAAHNYFSVFEANAGDIGELDDTVGAQIVCFYQAARSWLDSTSAQNIPTGGATTAAEEAFRHEVLARQIRKICALGDALVETLADDDMSRTIIKTAEVLSPGEIPPVLPRGTAG